MSKFELKPQSQKMNTRPEFWNSLHNKVQYLLDIHKQNGKTELFPFDLQYMLNNMWHKTEVQSYQIVCNTSDFHNDDNTDKMLHFNRKKIETSRSCIHDRIQYLLSIHSEHDINKPFPLDLAYMLDVNCYYLGQSFDYDKKYNYDRKLNDYFYTGRVYAISPLLNNNKPSNQYEYFDAENLNLNDINYLKYYIEENIPDEIPGDYLLWKSACYDINYDYKRIHCSEYYNPDTYLPEEEIYEPEEYYTVYDEEEPRYNTFNHFDSPYKVNPL